MVSLCFICNELLAGLDSGGKHNPRVAAGLILRPRQFSSLSKIIGTSTLSFVPSSAQHKHQIKYLPCFFSPLYLNGQQSSEFKQHRGPRPSSNLKRESGGAKKKELYGLKNGLNLFFFFLQSVISFLRSICLMGFY